MTLEMVLDAAILLTLDGAALNNVAHCAFGWNPTGDSVPRPLNSVAVDRGRS